MNANAPERTLSDQRHLWFGFAIIIYGGGFIADWAWWIHDGGWVGVLFGWAPALLWPIHALSAFWILVL